MEHLAFLVLILIAAVLVVAAYRTLKRNHPKDIDELEAAIESKDVKAIARELGDSAKDAYADAKAGAPAEIARAKAKVSSITKKGS